MEFPAGIILAPVPGNSDLIAFQYGFAIEGKAVEGAGSETITVEENGDLIIEGYAAVFDGLDREGENFAEGAFQRGVKAFLGAQSSLCYHHKNDKLLGKVLDLAVEKGKGLKMRARVDGAIRKHPELGVYYEQIKNGSLSGLSVGGIFRRALTAAGRKITDMDFTEISVTPVPIHPGTSFAVVAGKALTSDIDMPDGVSVALPDGEIRDEDAMWITESVATLDRILSAIKKRNDSLTIRQA